jgi:tRNA (adenine37-N6)-methyltransferase
MADEKFEVVPVAHVVCGRREPTDDHWGGTEPIIRIDKRFTEESVQLAEFSVEPQFHSATCSASAGP